MAPRLFLLSAFFVLLSIFAYAQNYTTLSISRSIPGEFGASDVTNALRLFDGEGDLLEISRGVIMQGIAGFASSSGEAVPPAQVSVNRNRTWYFFGVDSYCIKIGNADCAEVSIPPENFERLLEFVQNHRLIAFSLPGNARDGRVEFVRRALTRAGLVPTSFYPLEIYYGREARVDWIAQELDNEYFASMFRLVDFDTPPFVSNREGDTAEILRNRINTQLGHTQEPAGRIVDNTWLNADLESFFVMQALNGELVCSGLPARFTWRLVEGQRNAFITRVQYAAEPTSQSSLLYRAHQVFCITAVLRRLQSDNPNSLSAVR
ncbi:hypothetical protein ROLI_013580 [Roseobacter fucihabitans]|uniref:Uncharacterized protein n=1 Tax=Roseobacter fucihabitans TaxID=1537242 RepID=A0ABZ2BS83_9RHOB|nr:hypothetical protein [Roseobacter litoralis]MBC6967019.1 hypothetical protein [Roseobacter litoralis]